MKKIFVFFFKLILFLIIAFVCFAILQIAIEEYQDYKWKKPTSEERKIIKENQLKTQERNERLYSCLVDNKETSLKLKNTECEAYADGKKVNINDDTGKKDFSKKERNERLYSCLRDNKETSLKLKNTECEAYADGGKVDFNDDSGKKDIIKNLKSKDYDQRYNKCYTEMTVAHSKRGLLKSNIELSVKVRNSVCKAYAKGEELNYEGKR